MNALRHALYFSILATPAATPGLGGLVASTCPGERDQSEHLARWISAEWALARSDLALIGGSIIRYSTKQFNTLDAAGLEALRRDIDGRVDHPMRSMLEAELRRSSKGPDTTSRVVVYARGDRWRYNLDASTLPHGGYADTARSGILAWQLTPHQLTIATSETAAYFGVVNDPGFLSPLRLLVFGGFGYFDLVPDAPILSATLGG